MGKKLVLLLALYMAGCSNDYAPPLGKPTSITLVTNEKQVCVIDNVYMVREWFSTSDVVTIDAAGNRFVLLTFEHINTQFKWDYKPDVEKK